MTPCATCGNEYDKAFTVTQAGETLTFDSFQCAIHRMAPHLRRLRLSCHRTRRGP